MKRLVLLGILLLFPIGFVYSVFAYLWFIFSDPDKAWTIAL